MKSKDFFRKVKSEEIEGEPMATVDELSDYLKNPQSYKVYNTTSQTYASTLTDIINDNCKNLEAKFFEFEEEGDKKRYKLGIFYKNSSEE